MYIQPSVTVVKHKSVHQSIERYGLSQLFFVYYDNTTQMNFITLIK